MSRCDCHDPGCPVGHPNRCLADVEHVLLRIDMSNDEVWMCAPCAEDALESGLFDFKTLQDFRGELT